jgi:hypothetical protein
VRVLSKQQESAVDGFKEAVGSLETALHSHVVRDLVDVCARPRVRGCAPSAGCCGALRLDSLAKPLLGFVDMPLHGFLG